jgi:hypothetical protein
MRYFLIRVLSYAVSLLLRELAVRISKRYVFGIR